MSLLDIIGVSIFNTSFYSCFAFLRKEEEEDIIGHILGADCQLLAIVHRAGDDERSSIHFFQKCELVMPLAHLQEYCGKM